MPAPNPARQKSAWADLDKVFAEAHNTWVIHYSCESFYDRPEGRSPRITSIALRRLHSGQTSSFSIHQTAERKGIPFRDIDAHYDSLEREMLDAFYALIGSHRGMKYLHWNMRDANYGFAAIEHRYRVLGGDPVVIEDDKKYDLARLLIDIYGKRYAGHPRLESLIALNHIKPLDFMNGPQEAEAFETRNFVGLHQSTLRKVDIIANIAGLAHDRALKTNTTWHEMHGGRIRGAYRWVAENKGLALLGTLTGIIGFAITIWGLM
jgi:hypothetical protein